jgi:tetratricopeptide (TPR) repeat protein
MAEPSQGGLTGILARETWTAEEHSQLLKELFSIYDAAAKFKGILGDLEARDPDPKGPSAVKIGIGRYMLCRFQDALAVLANGTDNKDRRFFQGLCYKQLRQFDKAVEELHLARERGWDGPEVDVNVVECLALKGDLDAAEKALKDVAKKIVESCIEHGDPLPFQAKRARKQIKQEVKIPIAVSI